MPDDNKTGQDNALNRRKVLLASTPLPRHRR
jgi:hypothetical protein